MNNKIIYKPEKGELVRYAWKDRTENIWMSLIANF